MPPLVLDQESASVVATAAQIDAAATISANTNVRLAITDVGTTYPGTDLSVFVYSQFQIGRIDKGTVCALYGNLTSPTISPPLISGYEPS
jgi:hypothetical protein